MPNRYRKHIHLNRVFLSSFEKGGKNMRDKVDFACLMVRDVFDLGISFCWGCLCLIKRRDVSCFL